MVEARGAKADKSALLAFAKKVLNALNQDALPPGINELNILLTDDAHIKSLNADFRGKDKPTDVLSFSALESPAPPRRSALLGEIAISMEAATRQAESRRINLSDELRRLVIHGILHLFGYDHLKVSAAKARKMRRLEDELLEGLKT